jgi:ELWxxDGT repeat protein
MSHFDRELRRKIALGLGALMVLLGAGPALAALVEDINSGLPSSVPEHVVRLNATTLLFAADDGANGVELWKSEGSAATTSIVKNIAPGDADSFPASLTLVTGAGVVLFAADDDTNGNELWKSNGFFAGTSMVKDINGGAASSSPREFVQLPGPFTVVFVADSAAEGSELWVTDGTLGGTSLVLDIRPGAAGSNPEVPTLLGAKVYFSADDGVTAASCGH